MNEVGLPKFAVGDKVTYLDKERTVEEIMHHPKGFLYMFVDFPLAVLEAVLTGEKQSCVQSMKKT